MDGLFLLTTLEKTFTTSIDDQYQNLAPITKFAPMNDFFLCKEVDFSGMISFDLICDDDLFVFTDGSFKNDVASFGICIFSGASWRENFSLYEKNQILTPRKSILDAEAIALVIGLRHSLSLGYTGHIYLILDNQTALRIFLPSPPPDLQYLTSEIHTLLKNSTQTIRPTWIKGHSGNKGNDRADTLAKTATDLTPQYDGPSYSHLNLTISTRCTTEWNEWFNRTEHYYKRRPSRRLSHHQHHTRLDSIALFKLRTNKGWNPKDPIGVQTPPPCNCDGTTPRDGAHICQYPIYTRARPPDILEWIHSDKHINSVLKWIRHHRHFKLKASTSQVRWVNLTKPGNLERDRVFNCTICA